jgi:hypothetical protein
LFEKQLLTLKRKFFSSLHILHGDFSVMTDGEKYRNLSAEIWDKVLPKVNELAEKDN